MSRRERPFANLGQHLRNVREQSKRSLAEVSGAIEIDEQALRLIEIGQKRPEEEVMLLLISYFNVQDQEALHLWELAKYDSDLSDHLRFNGADADVEADASTQSKPVIMMLTMDVRTLYSDGIEINTNQAGVTFNFTQSGSQGAGNNVSVARLGVSYTQAEEVLHALQTALLHAKYVGETKLLPPSTRKRSKKQDSSH
jgi:hypothetical protein